MANWRQLQWLQKEDGLCLSLWENYSSSYLSYNHSKNVPDEFIVSIDSFKSSLIHGPI